MVSDSKNLAALTTHFIDPACERNWRDMFRQGGGAALTWLSLPSVKGKLCTGCLGKIVFFTIHCNPSLAYIAVREPQSSRCNASVQPLLLAGNFFVQPIAVECWRGRGGKLSRILEKKHII